MESGTNASTQPTAPDPSKPKATSWNTDVHEDLLALLGFDSSFSALGQSQASTCPYASQERPPGIYAMAKRSSSALRVGKTHRVRSGARPLGLRPSAPPASRVGAQATTLAAQSPTVRGRESKSRQPDREPAP